MRLTRTPDSVTIFSMKVAPIVGALVGGIAGAVLWGIIVAVTKFEIGYMATGVGFLVGFGSAKLGGRGQINGILCGIIALLSMFGGKMASIRFGLAGAMKEYAKSQPNGTTISDAE